MTSELLRIATAGSVDDGKSTLIGRLLYDTKSILADQLDAVEAASERMGIDYVNLALLTDGLRAEREQGITIDVAHRYFATHRRKIIIADTPGHIQYTRNMVTGASTANLALVLVDVRHGVVEQSRRHAFIASLLGIPHLVLCVNKMDLADYSQEAFEEVRQDFKEFAQKLDMPDLCIIPVSALHGDNVVERSQNMPWYEGPSLLHHLNEVHISSDKNLIDARFAVQYVLRPHSDEYHDYRGYAGTVESGGFRPGEEVMVLPSGFESRISSIDTADGSVPEAVAGEAVSLRLEDDLDISRGDMICRPGNRPTVSQDVDAMICWMSEQSELRPKNKYAVKHTSRWARALVDDIRYRLDINTLSRDEDAESLVLNEIGRVKLRTTAPLFFDPYQRNRATGSFILVDETTNATVAGGMILREAA